MSNHQIIWSNAKFEAQWKNEKSFCDFAKEVRQMKYKYKTIWQKKYMSYKRKRKNVSSVEENVTWGRKQGDWR